jgi:flagella basal body P-ring formation protein FlgA
METSKGVKKALRGLAVAALVVMGAAVASFPAGAAGLTSVRVYDRSEVMADQILLGAIARVDGEDAVLVRKLQNVSLGRAPLPGKTRSLDAATILSRLRQSGIDPERLDLQVPAEITISREAVTVEREQIEEIVRRYIHQQVTGTPGESIAIKDIRVSEPVVLPKGVLATHVNAPKNSELAGSVPLQVTFSVAPDFERRVWVTVSLERRVNVVVARRPLGRFKPLEADDLEVKALDVGGLPAERIDDPEVAIGKRTRRAVDSGTVLRPDLLEFPPLVKRGDRVRIIAESAGLRISAFGQAKQKGAQGEMIPVVNLDSNKVVHARVVDSHTVRIDF